MIPIVFIIGSSFYAYLVNARKALDDPSKRDYSPYAILIAPISLPLIIVFNVLLLILISLAFGLFLVIFPFTLLFFRKPFLFKWISKQALKIGNFALKVNTAILRTMGFYPHSTHNPA